MGSLNSDGSHILHNENVIRHNGQISLSNISTDEVTSTIIPFTPDKLSNNILWLDADDRSKITIDENNKVSLWADKSINSFPSLTQDTPDNRPIYIAGAQNKRGGILFNRDASTSLYTDTAVFTDYPATIAFVFKANQLINSQELFFIGDKDSTTDCIHFESLTSLTRVRMVVSGTSNMNLRILTVGNTEMLIVRFIDTSTRKCDMNGVSEPGGGVRLMQNFDRTAMGRAMGSSPTNAFNGYFYETVAYNRALTDAEVTLLENYFIRKWAISSYE